MSRRRSGKQLSQKKIDKLIFKGKRCEACNKQAQCGLSVQGADNRDFCFACGFVLQGQWIGQHLEKFKLAQIFLDKEVNDEFGPYGREDLRHAVDNLNYLVVGLRSRIKELELEA